MEESIVEMAKELALALIQKGNLSPENVQDTLQKTYATLTALKAQEESETSAPVSLADPSPVDWRKSITRRTITCLECGHKWRQLTNRHLNTHGLDVHSYRTRYGIPRTQSLTCRDNAAQRRQIAQRGRPWEKAPGYIKGHARHDPPWPESEADIVTDEAEGSRLDASVQPKRQRQTTQKQQTGRKKKAAG